MEREFKWLISNVDDLRQCIQRITAERLGGAVEVLARSTANTLDLYFDSDDFELLARGQTMRVRHEMPSQAVELTLKSEAPGGTENGFLAREEARIPIDLVGRASRTRVADLLGIQHRGPLDSRLRLQVVLISRRFRVDLAVSRSKARVEASADEVTWYRADLTGTFGEVEAELLAGDQEAFVSFADILSQQPGLTPSRDPKLKVALVAAGAL